MRTVSLLMLFALAACAGGVGIEDVPPESQLGYRVVSDEGRETVGLAPPDSAGRYLLLPAAIDDVSVRAAGRPAPGDAVVVELLVEGAFPGVCDELARVEQNRTGHFITVALLMRQPRERVCAAVRRPFRYYLLLDGVYPAGSYTLTLNDATYPFQVLPAPADEAADG